MKIETMNIDLENAIENAIDKVVNDAIEYVDYIKEQNSLYYDYIIYKIDGYINEVQDTYFALEDKKYKDTAEKIYETVIERIKKLTSYSVFKSYNYDILIVKDIKKELNEFIDKFANGVTHSYLVEREDTVVYVDSELCSFLGIKEEYEQVEDILEYTMQKIVDKIEEEEDCRAYVVSTNEIRAYRVVEEEVEEC